MNKEIERKYAIKYLPEDIKIEKIQNIEQAFIYRDENTIIRIRKIETKQATEYVYTVKTKGDISYDDTYQIGQKYEIESNITKEMYKKVIEMFPEAGSIFEVIREFKEIMFSKKEEKLEEWINKTRALKIPEINSFINRNR